MSKFSLLTALTLDASGFNQGISSADNKFKGFGKSVQNNSTSLLKGFGALAIGAAGIGSAFEIAKKAIGATQFTADAFEVKMAQLTTGVDYFFIALSSGDWSNFFDGLTASIASAKELAEVLDNLADVNRSLTIQRIQLEGKQNALLVKMKDKTGAYTVEQQKKWYAEYIKNQEDFNKKELVAAYANRDALLQNYSDLSGLAKEDIYIVLSRYAGNYEKIFATMADKIALAKEEFEKVNKVQVWDNNTALGWLQGNTLDIPLYKNLPKLTQVEQLMGAIYLKYGKLNDAKLDNLTKSITDVQQVLNATDQFLIESIRLKNTLFKQEKVETTAPVEITPSNITFKGLDSNAILPKAIQDGIKPIKIDVPIVLMSEDTLAQIDSMNSAIKAGIEDMIGNLADGIGQLMAGGENAKKFRFGDNILLGLASFAQTFGRILIGIGVASDALKNAMKSGWGAIAAGVGLIALGGVIKGVVSNAQANLNSSVGNGSTGTYYTYGDQGSNASMRTSQVASAGAQTVQFRISGTDLVSVINNTNKKYNKLV
jgi:hypothetical protein